MEIEKKLQELHNELSEKEKTRLSKLAMDNIYSRYWCKEKGINYVNPDFREALLRTYEDIYE